MTLEIIKPGRIKERDRFIKLLNRQYKKGNWFWMFRVGDKLYSWDLGMQLYEDAYMTYFRKNIDKLKNLAENYCEVCVIDNSDIESKLDYRKQTQDRDHLQDIAIRRCFRRLGIWFKGKDLFLLHQSEYDDFNIRFHLPHLIIKSDKKQSIRSWYNSSRIIVVAQSISDKSKLAEVLVT